MQSSIIRSLCWQHFTFLRLVVTERERASPLPPSAPAPVGGKAPLSEAAVRNLVREEVTAAVAAALAQPTPASTGDEWGMGGG